MLTIWFQFAVILVIGLCNPVQGATRNRRNAKTWSHYVDMHLAVSPKIDKALICGYDGSLWSTESVKLWSSVSLQERQTVISHFSHVSWMAQNGLSLAGVQYMYLSSSSKVVRARKDSQHIFVFKTHQTFIFVKCAGFPEECSTPAQMFAEYLISTGY